MRRVHFDLCSGEQTWRAGAKPSGFGPESYSLEINPKQPSTWTCDIREAPIREINALLGRPVLMTFSPPCTTFSIASCSTHWTAPPNRQPKTTEAIEGQEIVIAGLDLIRRFNPLYVVVENPRGLLRKMPFMQDEALGMIRKTVTYCTYQDEGRRMKPTDLWINKRLDSIGSLARCARITCITGSQARPSIPSPMHVADFIDRLAEELRRERRD